MNHYMDYFFSGNTLRACVHSVNQALRQHVQGFVIESIGLEVRPSQLNGVNNGESDDLMQVPHFKADQFTARLTFNVFTNTLVNPERSFVKSPVKGSEKVVLDYEKDQLASHWRKDYSLEQNLALMFFNNLHRSRPLYPQAWGMQSPKSNQDIV